MHQIRYFLAVCETLNFTRAAETCNVSQPALTKAVKKLEGELGNPLFFREGKRVLITEFGRLMRPNLQAIHGQTESVRNLAEGFNLLNKSPSNVGIMTTIARWGWQGFWPASNTTIRASNSPFMKGRWMSLRSGSRPENWNSPC